jgi:ATP-dependent helicase/nuclease subunit B
LINSADGPPLILVAPRQSTYELERQILFDSSVPGFTRLQILSFERLAYYALDMLGRPLPNLLDEEGRLMVLRGILARHRDDLKLFRATARLTGFAGQLSLSLREFQRHGINPDALTDLSEKVGDADGLRGKLHDLGAVFRLYNAWLQSHRLRDSDSLLSVAADALFGSKAAQSSDGEKPSSQPSQRKSHSRVPRATARDDLFSFSGTKPGHPAVEPGLLASALWVDGFGELDPAEINLLAALLPRCGAATLTFCVDPQNSKSASWLSSWSLPARTYEDCRLRIEELDDARIETETLPRIAAKSRFSKSPELRHIEEHWDRPVAFAAVDTGADAMALRSIVCENSDAESMFAAREILKHVRNGGRYRDVAVLVRSLESYGHALQRAFSRYEIPFFMDRRQAVSHHPLAELTRNALRSIAHNWDPEDWFAALKSGLVPASDEELDWLENVALARGWRGSVWLEPLIIKDNEDWTSRVQELQKRLIPPFEHLGSAVGTAKTQITGTELARALRDFWEHLGVEEQLQKWTDAEAPQSGRFDATESLHASIWTQMNNWLANLELGFSEEKLRLRDWLPILEAGFAGLTVGVIPPALDQVLVGPADRSRNPDVRITMLLGLNEGVFPAPRSVAGLLSEDDRVELLRHAVRISGTVRQHVAREGYYGYVACTRAREKLLLVRSRVNPDGQPLNPSPFLSTAQTLFPSLADEHAVSGSETSEVLHPSDIVVPLIRRIAKQAASPEVVGLMHPTNPATSTRLERLAAELAFTREPDKSGHLPIDLAAKLHGPVLKTSVSRMEQFAACPFRFFINSGLRAEERRKFELDVREQGSFQHEILARFHNDLRQQGLKWRDITPAEARQRVQQLGVSMIGSYRDGLLKTSAESRFMGRLLVQSLQDFTEVLVYWMRNQYLCDPVAVELDFGMDDSAPGWTIGLGSGRSLVLRGRIDRVDIWRVPETNAGLCVVIDYKSSRRKLEPLLIENGLQLQLLAYLNVLRQWPKPALTFGVDRLLPAGVFYVSLRGRVERSKNRNEALSGVDDTKRSACAHSGRFDAAALPYLDSRENWPQGDQFNYRRNKGGDLRKDLSDVIQTADFQVLLDDIERILRDTGEQIFQGDVSISPFRKGSQIACDQCDYESICRVDPWTQEFRILKPVADEAGKRTSDSSVAGRDRPVTAVVENTGPSAAAPAESP